MWHGDPDTALNNIWEIILEPSDGHRSPADRVSFRVGGCDGSRRKRTLVGRRGSFLDRRSVDNSRRKLEFVGRRSPPPGMQPALFWIHPTPTRLPLFICCVLHHLVYETLTSCRNALHAAQITLTSAWRRTLKFGIGWTNKNGGRANTRLSDCQDRGPSLVSARIVAVISTTIHQNGRIFMVLYCLCIIQAHA
jgi:hypothetical protein